MSTISRRALLGGTIATAAALALPRSAGAAGLERLGIDYAHYNPPSLILKQNGWLEEALKPLGTQVDWVLSLGSNKANSFLAANVVQFGSTAGSAALLARANGSPIHTVFLFSQPEWTALVIAKDAKFRTVRDLRGKKIAVTKGTDPYFFLLRALDGAGVRAAEVELVELQHPDGRTALERGQVDAWAGLDPHMAASELDAGSRLLYRNVNFNTYGALNAREDVLKDHPDVVATVLKAYRRAHDFAARHPDETAKIVADASKLELRVTERQLRLRTRYPNPIPGDGFRSALAPIVSILRDASLALPGADIDGALASLVDSGPSRSSKRA